MTRVFKTLLVEDSQERIDWFRSQYRHAHRLTVVSHPDDAIRELSTPGAGYERLCLDHDLGCEPKAGRDVATWLNAHPDVLPDLDILVHSVNMVSGPKIERECRAAGRPCAWVPFPDLVKRV